MQTSSETLITAGSATHATRSPLIGFMARWTPTNDHRRPLYPGSRAKPGLILLCLFFLGAALALSACGNSTPTATQPPTEQVIATQVVTELPTATHAPTETPPPTPTPTETPPPSPTACPSGLVCNVLPQVDGGEEFTFINNPGALKPDYAAECAHSGALGLRLTYGFSSVGNGGWGVQWDSSPAGFFNAAGHSQLVFWIKGNEGEEAFHIGLRDDTKEVKLDSKKWVEVTTSWTRAQIALTGFKDSSGPINAAIVKNINFGFNKDHGAGSICVDDIAFE